ncbi:MAG: cytochrome c peroxidase [Planctomycetota bacterium]|jgi:cytochrome c peroxidase
MPSLRHLLPATLLGVALAAAQDLGGLQDKAILPSDTLPTELSLERPFGLDRADPLTVAPSTELIALGRQLFFDPLLSTDSTVACASCHQPAYGFADPNPLSIGIHGQRTLRNSPSLLNRSLGEHFMWDGSAGTLEEQVLMPMANPLEMGTSADLAVERLNASKEYSAAFEAVTGAAPKLDSLASALASFIRTLHLGDSPVDRFRAGQADQLTEEERAGLWLYESRGRCWRCHSGPNFTDESFHNTGVGAQGGQPEEGRFGFTADEADRGKFKTPTLRGLAQTGPYMHDGSLETLEDVVRFYRDGGHANASLSEFVSPITFSDRDVTNLAALLRALSREATGKPPAAKE